MIAQSGSHRMMSPENLLWMKKEHVAVVIGSAVVIEAALNGGRDRSQNEAVPYTAGELAAEARRCADEGATVFHIHARADDGAWTADPARYARVLQDLREAVPDG